MSNDYGTASDHRWGRGLERVGVLVVALAGVLALLGYGISRLADINLHIGGRDHLQAIPIRADACPYVALMHHAANEFQASYPTFLVSVDANGQLVPWPQVRTQISQAVDHLEQAIDAGGPHLPPRVQGYLAITRKDIDAGRGQLILAPDEVRFATQTVDVERHGQRAFGNASDLIGRRCGVHLAADSPQTSTPSS